MNCEELRAAIGHGFICEVTEQGTRFETHCLYPSFEPVSVYITQAGDGFRISDGAGAARSALMHGKDDDALAGAFKKATLRYGGVSERHGIISCEVQSSSWLYSGLLAVANASAMAAELAVEHSTTVAEINLRALIRLQLTEIVDLGDIATDYDFVGSSGRVWPVDFAVLRGRKLLIKAVTPHGNSVNSNYTTFGDIGAVTDIVRYSVFHPDRELRPEDSALIRQVAELVPLSSLPAGARRELSRV